MKHIKLFEDFKVKNFTIDDILKCISSGGIIYSNAVRDYPEHDPDMPLNPLSVDEDGLITVEVVGRTFEVDINNVKRIEK